MFSRSQLKSVILFGLLAAGSYLMWQLSTERKAKAVPEAFTKGYAATGITGKNSNDQGEFIVRYQADELIQYDQSDRVELTYPKVWTRHQGRDDWSFRALQAFFDRGDDAFHFEKQVQANNLHRPAEERIDFNTESLSLMLSSRLAQTADPVQLNGYGVAISAIGAEFDLRNNRHRLLSKVNMEYDESPQQPRPLPSQAQKRP
jgi:LPS export ABC transporter protein LptC